MSREEILAFFPGLPTCATHLGAASYHVPTLKWLQGPFYDFFTGRYWDEGLGKWTRRYECRDFARAYAAAAIECWALTNELSDDDALAVGEIWYPPTPTTGHAICPVFTENGLQFIDPQNNQLCTLTSEQLAQRYFLRF